MSTSGAALLLSLRRAEEGAELDSAPAAQLLRRLKRRRPAIAADGPAKESSPSLEALLRRRPSSHGSSGRAPAEPAPTTAAEEALPPHLQRLKSGLAFAQESLVELPVLRVLSPRSRRRAAQLPPPNAAELARLEELCGRAEGSPYQRLVLASDRRRAREHRGVAGRASDGPLLRAAVDSVEGPRRGFSGPPPREAYPAVMGSGDTIVGTAGASELFELTRRVQQRSQELEERLREGRTADAAPHITAAGQTLRGAALERVEGVVAGVFDELGVDLDPRFNRMRRLRRGVEVVALFWRRERYRAGLQRLLTQSRRASAALVERAGELLRRVGRGFLARVHYRALRLYRQRQRQAEQLARRAAARARVKTLATVMLVGALLRRKVRSLRFKRRETAASAVQRAWRRFALRRSVRGAAAQLSQRARAAVRVQSTFRCHLARRKVPCLRGYSPTRVI